MLVGIVAEWANWATPSGEAVNQCLLIGALVGAICWPWVAVTLKILHGIKSGLALVVARSRPSGASTNL